MTRFAIIGGSGFSQLSELKVTQHKTVDTPYGEPSAPLTYGVFGGQEIVFLPRHGVGHSLPPHQINYRANIWALQDSGVKQIIGMGAVGGIRNDMAPGCVAIPNQIIDYTWGRAHTFFDQDDTQVTHVDFTEPYSKELRDKLIAAGKAADIDLLADGTYGAVQGPRLETAMEINRMERDGCDLVGMTGMPEASLARELELEYACCAVVANWAAGRGDGPIAWEEIEANLDQGMGIARRLLLQFVS
ncbi:5'-methylthioadenosine phosphorylase [hydrothermal vent metagenome]|uniref:5'-methylthioadenosine phosphorylase n=1 Tax=hydrothermal vent metagenome TaxID=652676 RepID=A0A3B1B9Y7_9ZZZZ